MINTFRGMTSNLDNFLSGYNLQVSSRLYCFNKGREKNTENLKLHHKYLPRGSKMMRLAHEGASLERAALQTL